MAGSAVGVPAAAPPRSAVECPIPDRPEPDAAELPDAGRLTATVTDSNCSTTPTLHGTAMDTGTGP